ncbi:MAG: FtsW/RodA/SpoVE family cell cycle protein [Acidimicrobiia bacterium]
MAAPRRNTELGLIVMAGLVTVAAYVLGELGQTSALPTNIIPFSVIMLGLLLVPHLVARVMVPGADSVLLPLAALLNGVGYVFIARINDDLAGLQATWTALGVAAFAITLLALRRVRDLQRYQWTFALAGIGLLLLPIVPGLGFAPNDARLWIRVGTITFQPGEVAKICLALFLAAYLTDRREVIAAGTLRIGRLSLPEPRDLGPVLVAWGASLMVMIFEKDLGSSLLFFTLFVVMLWVATEKGRFLVIGAGLFGIGAYGAYQSFQHVRTRVATWLDPWSRVQGKGYQLVQSSFAFAWGGVTGTGIGLGDPTRVPAVQTDFILAAIGEELGLVGATAVLISYILMIGAGLRIALATERTFDKLLATGLTTILGVQAFVIIGGVVRLVPLTGVTLPFVSYGGSSLLANYVLIAILMRISHDSAVRRCEVAEPPTRIPRRVKREAARKAAHREEVAGDLTVIDARPSAIAVDTQPSDVAEWNDEQ